MFPAQDPIGVEVIEQFPYRVLEDPTVWIPLSDGTRLAARVWRPMVSENSLVPAVFEFIPYRRRDGTLADDERIHPYYAGHGVASLRVDMRGSGDSDGVLEDEYLPREQDDAIEVIEWISQQPWCNGKVGMTGLSWGGFNSLQVAARAPKALQAVVCVGVSVDRYGQDIHYKNGCLLNENFGWGTTLMSFMTRPPDPAVVGDRWRSIWLDRLQGLKFFPKVWLEHPARDDYWRHASVCEDYGSIKAAVMVVAGWGDLYVNAVPELLANLDVPCRAIAGPWAHQFPHLATPGPAIDYLGEASRWWQRWLTDQDEQVDPSPTYLAYLQEGALPNPFAAEVPGIWIRQDCWPNPASETQIYYLCAEGLIKTEQVAPPWLIHSPTDTGFNSGEWVPHCFGPEMPQDQRVDDAGSLVFDSEPLLTNLDILGEPVLELTLASDCSTGNLIVRLCDVEPDGASTRVCLGTLNLMQRNGNERPVPMPHNQPVPIRVRLDHVAHRFRCGNRIRVALSTSYWPLIWPAIDDPTLLLTPTPAKLILPLCSCSKSDQVSLDAPRIPRAANTRTIRAAKNERKVTRDLVSGRTTLEIEDDYGELEFVDHGMINSGTKREVHNITWEDPLSATCNIQWTHELRRRSWHVRTETQAHMACDARYYHVDAMVIAYEGEIEVFKKQFKSSIPRC